MTLILLHGKEVRREIRAAVSKMINIFYYHDQEILLFGGFIIIICGAGIRV
jgi:hypothetical protein